MDVFILGDTCRDETGAKSYLKLDLLFTSFDLEPDNAVPYCCILTGHMCACVQYMGVNTYMGTLSLCSVHWCFPSISLHLTLCVIKSLNEVNVQQYCLAA